MDELSWMSCVEPKLLVSILLQQGDVRKLRLLACALVRHAPFGLDGATIWDLLPTFPWYRSATRDGRWIDCREVILLAEKKADGRCEEGEWNDAQDHGLYCSWVAEVDTFGDDTELLPGCNFREAAAIAVREATKDEEHVGSWLFGYRAVFWSGSPERGVLHPDNGKRACMLTREVFGNPFRPIDFKRRWESGEVLKWARRIYEDQAYEFMPRLGAALRSAGCRESEILQHCDTHDHVRGCWVIDLVLSKGSGHRPRGPVG